MTLKLVFLHISSGGRQRGKVRVGFTIASYRVRIRVRGLGLGFTAQSYRVRVS